MEKGRQPISTLPRRGLKSGAALLAFGTQEREGAFFDGLSDGTLKALPYLWEFWALPHQVAPEGKWRTWAILGGRGAGKTRAGAEWVRAQVEGATPEAPGRASRVALVAETHDQAREVMVFGDSGILACSPPDRRPVWQATRRRLEWPNGAVAQTFSASDPEGLRGPQFDAAWCDELAKWSKGDEAWDMLQFALRLGASPRCVVTTTPRNTPLLKQILETKSTRQTAAPTNANKANLAASFLAEVEARYGGTLLGRQELDGVLVDEAEGAFWTAKGLDAIRIGEAPELDRIVVAVDPSVTSGAKSDACGIVVAGVVMKGAPQEWFAVVLEDCTVERARPGEWADVALAALERHEADRLVVETNQGGDLIKEMFDGLAAHVPYATVTARKSKIGRAEPVASLYERGRVRHLPGLGALEAEMCQMTRTGFDGNGSPDRLDALVWALTDLMLTPAKSYGRPQIRAL